MSEKKQVTYNGISGFTVFIIFFVLKMTGVVDWSWWWITCPLWIQASIVLFIFLIAGLIAGMILLVKWISDKVTYGF